MNFTLIPLLWVVGCTTLPDPLTCNPEDPLCQKAELREQRRLERAERRAKKCPAGYVEYNIQHTTYCLDPVQSERMMQGIRRGWGW